MPIDYSKWDKIELSDDSDIEVHPNVDKNSFIKWKQRDIHEKRQQRNIEIKSILVQLTMYAKLNERVDYLLNSVSEQDLLSNSTVVEKINEKFDKSEKFDYEKLIQEKGNNLRKGLKDLKFDKAEIENTPPYNEMIEDLFIQVKEDHPEANTNSKKLTEYIKEHRNKIDDVLSRQTIKLDDLLYQKSMLISSDDIHTGFDKSFLNKEKNDEEITESKLITKEADKKPTEKVTSTEVINQPSEDPTTLTKASEDSEKDVLDELEVLKPTSQFAKIPSTELRESGSFLFKHPSICTEQQKDALVMTAFDHQLQGDVKTTKQIIHQSLLLQYISQLAGPNSSKDQTIKAIKLFLSKISDDSSPAKQAFQQDVENTFNHIKTRCEIIKQEQESNNDNDNGEEALIQLKALDDKTELFVNIPKEGTDEYDIFSNKLSSEMQEAVKTGSLDEVNKVFAKLKIEEAEEILEIFNECAVIGINGYIEDEDEFKELQKQYNEEMDLEGKSNEENKLEEIKEVNTADIVD